MEDGDSVVLGFACASNWKGGCAYRFSVEVTVYLSPIATKLYGALFDQLRDKSMHSVLCGIALPNEASIAQHEKFGIEKVAHFKQVGFKFGRWVDVGYWQGLL